MFFSNQTADQILSNKIIFIIVLISLIILILVITLVTLSLRKKKLKKLASSNWCVAEKTKKVRIDKKNFPFSNIDGAFTTNNCAGRIIPFYKDEILKPIKSLEEMPSDLDQIN